MQRIRILKLYFPSVFFFSSLPENALEGICHLTFALFKNIGSVYVGKVIIKLSFLIISTYFLSFYSFNCLRILHMHIICLVQIRISPSSFSTISPIPVPLMWCVFFKPESTWCSLYASWYSTTYKETDLPYKGTMRFQQPFRLGGIFISACYIHAGF